MNGNFYNTPRPLCFKWQRVIPAVYDDALTYDALMMKIIYTVNKIIENQYLSVPYLISTSFQATNDSIHVTGSLMQDYEAINLDVELVTTGMDDGQYYINVYNESKAKYVGKDVNQQPPLYISTQFMPMNCTTLYKFQILDGKIVQDSIEYNDLYTHMHNIDPEAHKELFEGVNARITQEINDRIAADTQLQSNIDAETEARKEADNALESSITTERSERIAADTALQNNINAEATARENADTTLQNNINAEATARENADTTLQNNIDTEIQDREDADTQLQTSINNEVQARKDAITAEENARKQADTALGNRIDTEISDRQAAVTQLQSNIDAETEARKEADNALESSITTERSERIAADTALQNNINAEATARENADTTLQNNINAEATARENADTTLQNNIDTEIQDREDADTQLQTSINNEVQARKDAITAEENARKQADTALGNRIDTEISDRQAAVTGVQNNLTNHINNKANPHGVTKAQVGLENVTNTVGVTKLNNIDGSVNLVAGANITISNDPTGKNITIGSTGGGGGGTAGVNTLNNLQGDLTITGSGLVGMSAVGTNIDLNVPELQGGTGINVSGTTIINAGVTQVNGATGNVTFTGGNGINISGRNITNSGVLSIQTPGGIDIMTGNVELTPGTEGGIAIRAASNAIELSNLGVTGLGVAEADNPDYSTGNFRITGGQGISTSRNPNNGNIVINAYPPSYSNATFTIRKTDGTSIGYTGLAHKWYPCNEYQYLKGFLYTGGMYIPSGVASSYTIDFSNNNFYIDWSANPTYATATPKFYAISDDGKIIGYMVPSGNNTNKFTIIFNQAPSACYIMPCMIPIVSSSG